MIAPVGDSKTHSCLYYGQVAHTRHEPQTRSFRYSLFFIYLDLAEVDSVFARHWFWSTGRPNIAWFRRSDHFGDADVPLDQCVRQLVRSEIGRDIAGPIRLLTHPRYFGYVINPVSFFFCYDESGTHVDAVVAEVTNTPWGERHCYVIDGGDDQQPVIHAAHAKMFHVSPFMPMDMEYRWCITPPDETLSVEIRNDRSGRRVFEGTLSLQRRPITSANLMQSLARHPWMTAKVFTAIYWQAFKLWMGGATFHPHPKHGDAVTESPNVHGTEIQRDVNDNLETPVL